MQYDSPSSQRHLRSLNLSQASSQSSTNLTSGEKLLFSLSKAFNIQQSNKLDKQAQEALALYAEKIIEKRKKERETKQ